MFGGFGVFLDGLMFGLVADDVLYLKADAESSQQFESRGLGAFEYTKNGKTMKMSYFLAPEDIFDDKDEAKVWANRAYEAALRSKKPKKKTRKKATK